MPRITCLHGHEIELSPEQYGQRIACPACQLLMTVSPPRAGEALVPKYEVLCEQGHTLRVKSKYIGTQIRCPQCQGLAWVTTDRLQTLTPQPKVKVQPVQPVVMPTKTAAPTMRAPAMPLPPQRVVHSSAAMPVVPPVVPVATMDDIPVAEVDADIPVAKREDEEPIQAELGAGELTKAEKRNLNMVDQGLSLFTYSIYGYCGTKMVLAVLGFLLLLLSQTASAPTFNAQTRQLEGGGMLKFVAGVADVMLWTNKIAMVLNSMLFLAALALLMFTPWITIATVWFLLSLICLSGYAGYLIYQSIQAKTLVINSGIIFASDEGLIRGFGNRLSPWWERVLWEVLFFAIWFLVILGCWQLAKFCRKPQLRQSIIILMLIGIGTWALLHLLPLTGLIDPQGKASMWVAAIVNVILVIGLGLLLIFQHHSIVGQVQNMLYRQRK